MEHRVYDLNVPVNTMNGQLLARLLDAGYQCIAVTQSICVDDFNFSVKTDENTVRKKSKEERQEMRSVLLEQLKPPTSEWLSELLKSSCDYRATSWSSAGFIKPRLFRRLTIQCSEPSLAGLFFREFGDRLNQFDIVSFCPQTSAALAYACEQAPGLDLISLELSHTTENRLTGRQCSLMVSRGIRLEFLLSPLLQTGASGVTARTSFALYLSSLFSGVRPSFHKAIIVSSGASSAWEIRRPCAVVSMLQSLGFQPKQAARLALTEIPYAVLTHGLWRSRTAHGAAALLRLIANPAVISMTDVARKELANTSLEDEKPPPKRKCLEAH